MSRTREVTVIERDVGAMTAGAMTAGDIRAQVNRVQEVMQAVMRKDTHYGVIPGTKKPSLYKPGAEVLAATFRIAVSYRVEDLSSDGEIRYRVTAIGTHQTSGIVMGEGVGECSSGEEKYKWRAAICDEEFEVTPENRKRVKFSKWGSNIEKKKQVRTDPADQANTVLKMAAKRAQVAMTLNVTAASDIFTQDIEDLPEELRADDDVQPTRQDLLPYPDQKLTDNLKAWGDLVTAGKKPEAIITNIKTKYTLTPDQEKKIMALATAPAADSEQKHIHQPGTPDPEWVAAYEQAQGDK